VREAELSMLRHLNIREEDMLMAQGNLASAYSKLGRGVESIALDREVYASLKRLHGPLDETTLHMGLNIAVHLMKQGENAEAKKLLRDLIP